MTWTFLWSVFPSLIYGTVCCTTRCRKMCSQTWCKFVFRSCCWLVYTFVHKLHKCWWVVNHYETTFDVICDVCDAAVMVVNVSELQQSWWWMCLSCSNWIFCGVLCKNDNTCITLQVFVPVTPAFVWYVPHCYNRCRSLCCSATVTITITVVCPFTIASAV